MNNDKEPSLSLIFKAIMHFSRIIIMIIHWCLPFAFTITALIKDINNDRVSAIFYLCLAILAYISYESTTDWFEEHRLEFKKCVDKELK